MNEETPQTKILFVCAFKGVRSGIAAAVMNSLEIPGLTADYVGFERGKIHGYILERARARGLDLDEQDTPTVFDVADLAGSYDFVIVLCNQAGREHAGVLTDAVNVIVGDRSQVHSWQIKDFLAAMESDDKEAQVETILNDIEGNVLEFAMAHIAPLHGTAGESRARA